MQSGLGAGSENWNVYWIQNWKSPRSDRSVKRARRGQKGKMLFFVKGGKRVLTKKSRSGPDWGIRREGKVCNRRLKIKAEKPSRVSTGP